MAICVLRLSNKSWLLERSRSVVHVTTRTVSIKVCVNILKRHGNARWKRQSVWWIVFGSSWQHFWSKSNTKTNQKCKQPAHSSHRSVPSPQPRVRRSAVYFLPTLCEFTKMFVLSTGRLAVMNLHCPFVYDDLACLQDQALMEVLSSCPLNLSIISSHICHVNKLSSLWFVWMFQVK